MEKEMWEPNKESAVAKRKDGTCAQKQECVLKHLTLLGNNWASCLSIPTTNYSSQF